MSELESFRTETRAFLETKVPKSLRGRMPMMMEGGEEEAAEVRSDRARYLELMAERGWTAPMWPKQYGGGGLSPQQAKALQEELNTLKLSPALFGMGLSMI